MYLMQREFGTCLADVPLGFEISTGFWQSWHVQEMEDAPLGTALSR